MSSIADDIKSIASGAYGGAAEIGRVEAIVGAALATVIGILFTGIGIIGVKDPEPDPNHPNEPPSRAFGFIFIIAGVGIILLSWLSVWLTQKYKTVAAIGGAETLYRLV